MEFCREVRLYPARRILEFRFCPRYVSQHRVQPLRSQYQECEHKHDQDFNAETHNSPLG
jgi:hypothetical protein